jgi:DNA-binding MarR family transcriptional regulator
MAVSTWVTPALAERWLLVAWRVSSVFRTREGGPSLTQWQILTQLHDAGTLALMAVADRLGVTGATAARAVAAAERRGWIVKDRDPHDRRLIWLRATPDGEAVRQETAEQVAERLGELGRQLGDPERRHLLAALLTMAAEPQGRPNRAVGAGLSE